ncbi:Serine protease Do-like HtrA [Aquisphaera giovannonii]|uniref:Serine protease Do-like HtrA n=2 Tax=Aquisphaera giovannonii TaxID=406548 RepID=A0A5B9WFJ6_9BACT|nr:Serine protease Do-like HtrA [Aquisphaera giovannonii]
MPLIAAVGLLLPFASPLPAAATAAAQPPAPAADAKPAEGDQEARIRESVVKITATLRYPDILRPWTKQSPREASGTGVVIDGKRILTNAHMVLYASQLFVESQQSSDKLAATVEAVSPGMDLAVIRLDDESFFEKRPPLTRVQALPEVKEAVVVYGYPQGGSSLSVTKGIVSRIEFVGYNEGASGVRIQVDAPINPGNSGGPALVDGKMIGLIFSKLTQADNIGYIIPGEEIELFLRDIKDGHYDGKPDMHDSLQTFENAALRGFLQVDRKTQGMIVHRPAEEKADYPLKTWDLITKIGDKEIDNVGMVKVKENLRLQFRYLIQSLAKDEAVPMTIVRKGKPEAIRLPVPRKWPMLIEPLQGKYPPYFIYGPLVFSSASRDLAAALDRPGSPVGALLAMMGSPLATRRGDRQAFPGEELVLVTSPMFPHAIAKGYDNPFSKVVKEINGTKVKNLRHFVELIRDSKNKYTTISFDDRFSETIVFDHQEALKATDEILSDNGIRQQASDDLLSVWKKTN